jgi:hypothetical protein
MKKFLQKSKRRVVEAFDNAEAKFNNSVKAVAGKVAVALGLGLALGSTQPANAALDLSGITFDMGPVETIGLAIIIFLAGIWVIKVVINFIR